MRIHSLLSPRCKVTQSPISGRGIIAIDDFKAGELVAVWGGKIYSADEVNRLAEIFPHFATHTVSVYPGYYLGSENLYEFDDAELFNHSCNANVGVKGQIILVARRSITSGEELTFDYDTTETLADPFECKCGSQNCRGVINGTAWQNPEFIDHNRDFISWYILEKLRAHSIY